MAFFGGKDTKKRGETTWRVRDFSLVRCDVKEPENGTLFGEASGAET